MPAVAAPADRRFRRARVKPARRRKIGVRHVWLAAKVTAVLGVAIYGGWRGTALVLGAPVLQVSRLTLRGNERLSAGEVLALVDGLRGRNILTIDLKEWRARLLASPWVEDASLRRVLPGRVEIELHERRPMGIGRLNGALYLIDADGIVIDEYGPNYAEFDLPIIDGLATRPPQRASAIDESRAHLAARLIASLAARPDLAQKISQIDVTDAHDAVVLLEDDTTLVRLGDRDFAERIESYLELAPTLKERVSAIDYVDMRFDERLYVRPVGSGRGGDAGRARATRP
jgi:cell division protein FtsQ